MQCDVRMQCRVQNQILFCVIPLDIDSRLAANMAAVDNTYATTFTSADWALSVCMYAFICFRMYVCVFMHVCLLIWFYVYVVLYLRLFVLPSG